MIRLVLDTNVLISGTFWRGSSSQVIKQIEDRKALLILSQEIWKEYMKVLDLEEIRRKVAQHRERKSAALKLTSLGIFIIPKERIRIVEDPDDDKFIEAAVAGKAKYIITQDKTFLKVKKFRNIKTITPEEFLALRK